MQMTESEFELVLGDSVDRLRGALAPVCLFLCGSYAYGAPNRHSDIDLLVVVGDSPLDPYERDALAYRALGTVPFPIDVQVYTQREFDARAALSVSFERTVKQKSRLIHAA